MQIMHLLLFRLDEQKYGVPLDEVVRVVHAVEVTPLPGAPPVAMGVIDVEGQILPVLSIRYRLGIGEKPISPRNQFLIVKTKRRTVALVIDQADDVAEIATASIVSAPEMIPGLEHIRGVAVLEDGVVLIQDLDRFLSLDEESAIDRATELEISDAK
jgi:purine-binding chemotaxis protein CheW